MKPTNHFTLPLVFFAFTALVVSCKHSSETSSDESQYIEASVAGKLADTGEGVKIILIDNELENLAKIAGSRQSGDTAYSTGEGQFQLQKRIVNEGVYDLKVGLMRFPIYLIPGKEVKLEIHGDQIQFGGETAEMQNLLNQVRAWPVPEALEKMESSGDFYQEVKRRFNVKFAEPQNKDGSYSEVFNNIIRSQALHNILYGINSQELYDEMVSRKDLLSILDVTTNLAVSPDFSNTIAGIYYFELVLSYRNGRLNKENHIEKFSGDYRQIVKELSGPLREFCLAYQMLKDASQLGAVGLDNPLKEFRNEFTVSRFEPLVAENYDRWNAISDGKPFPEVVFTRPNGSAFSIDEMKGKLVYIDIWATWCKPCIANFPHAQVRHQELAGKEIEFLYISIDHEEEKWKSFLAGQELPEGIHVILNHKDAKSFSDYFKIDGIPRYMLLHKNGTIYNAFAPPPGLKEELYRQVEHLL